MQRFVLYTILLSPLLLGQTGLFFLYHSGEPGPLLGLLALELDASGIMVPHVMSYEDAKQVVYYSKFHPIGRRPIDGGNADGKYGLLSMEDYIRYCNEEKLTIIQIEDVEALDDIEKIAALPGIDMLFFGPADFSQSVGMPTQIGNERTTEAKRKVAEGARRHGKFAGTVGDPRNVKTL